MQYYVLNNVEILSDLLTVVSSERVKRMGFEFVVVKSALNEKQLAIAVALKEMGLLKIEELKDDDTKMLCDHYYLNMSSSELKNLCYAMHHHLPLMTNDPSLLHHARKMVQVSDMHPIVEALRQRESYEHVECYLIRHFNKKRFNWVWFRQQHTQYQSLAI